MTDVRIQYIKRMSGHVSMTTFEKFVKIPHVLDAISEKANQLLTETK